MRLRTCRRRTRVRREQPRMGSRRAPPPTDGRDGCSGPACGCGVHRCRYARRAAHAAAPGRLASRGRRQPLLRHAGRGHAGVAHRHARTCGCTERVPAWQWQGQTCDRQGSRRWRHWRQAQAWPRGWCACAQRTRRARAERERKGQGWCGGGRLETSAAGVEPGIICGQEGRQGQAQGQGQGRRVTAVCIVRRRRRAVHAASHRLVLPGVVAVAGHAHGAVREYHEGAQSVVHWR